MPVINVDAGTWSTEFQQSLQYLCDNYRNIQTWVEHKIITEMSVFKPAGMGPCKVKLVAQLSNGTSSSATFVISVDDLILVEANQLKLHPKPASRELGAIMPTAPKFTRCEVDFIEMPTSNFLKTKDQPAKSTWPTYAFRCKCSDSFLCSRITSIIEDYGDTRYWSNKIKNLNGFHLIVPVYGCVLYSFPVEAKEIDNWSGKTKKKLMAYGTTENETFFYEVPHFYSKPHASSMMPDQLRMLREFTDSIASKWKDPVVDFFEGKSAILCSSLNHTYGANQRFRRFLTESAKQLSAGLLVLELYEMCYPCYRNSTPAFSLLENDFNIS